MRTLNHVLASGVVEALQAQEHVLVAPSGGDALCDEVEAIIAPALISITPHLEERRDVHGEVTSTFGHERADEAVETMVEQITERLMESDHVDDIFAEDRIIRRDAFRAIREILMEYIRGEIEIDDEPEPSDGFEVRLDALGYVVSTVTKQLDEQTLSDSLTRAAESVGGTVLGLDMGKGAATFDLLGGAEVGRLALEEAITETMVALVDADIVELPGIEQVLGVESGDLHRDPRLVGALERAANRTKQQTECEASCIVVDAHTLLATLTPLSAEAVAEAELHFDVFLARLEEELAALATPGTTTTDEAAASESDRAPQSGARASRKRSSSRSPASSRKAKAGASEKPARASGTGSRARRGHGKTNGKKRRAKG